MARSPGIIVCRAVVFRKTLAELVGTTAADHMLRACGLVELFVPTFFSFTMVAAAIVSTETI